jgi:hypothetical protein
MMVLTFFKKTHDPHGVSLESPCLIFLLYEIPKVSKQHGYYLPIRPLDFKTSLSKKIGFSPMQLIQIKVIRLKSL